MFLLPINELQNYALANVGSPVYLYLMPYHADTKTQWLNKTELVMIILPKQNPATPILYHRVLSVFKVDLDEISFKLK